MTFLILSDEGEVYMLVVTSDEMRNIEKKAVENGSTYLGLMEKAGGFIAEKAAKIITAKKLKNIVILCGKGNNGGDGFVAARFLSVMCDVTVILADGEPKTNDAKMNFNLMPHNIKTISYIAEKEECINSINNAEILIDAIYGIGFKDALNPEIYELSEYYNENKKAVKISVDLPSGIMCDTGEIINGCFNADYTVTFTALKPLHILYPSMDFCGEVSVENVGVPKQILDECSYIMKTTDEYICENPLTKRRKSAHKGTNGTLFSLCGSYGMAGAAVLSGSAALRTGVGLLRMAVPKSIYELVSSKLTEAVFMPLKQNDDGTVSIEEFNKILYDVLEKSSAMLIGCGLGMNDELNDLVSLLIENSTKPIVLDADGINAVCMNINVLKRATVPLILTPHPGEMARLTMSDTRTVQCDRYNIAKNFAEEYGVTLVLKGANTLVATPDGNVYVNLTGNNGMAKGGSGDVLAGMIASFLAQGMSAEKAAVYGVYYHGLVGDLCSEKYSSRSMLPSDMVTELKSVWRNL
ncbi:MAG: NAD(P)H-hydrate dehydratase [Clostridia bacterium]|nr:NAD(P)H-hydrate dehydratase [Clostridia bacterium]